MTSFRTAEVSGEVTVGGTPEVTVAFIDRFFADLTLPHLISITQVFGLFFIV